MVAGSVLLGFHVGMCDFMGAHVYEESGSLVGRNILPNIHLETHPETYCNAMA